MHPRWAAARMSFSRITLHEQTIMVIVIADNANYSQVPGSHSQLEICSKGFFLSACSGTSASRAGNPATTIINGFSSAGRPQISRRNPIGEGVWVSVARPARCSAAKRKPQAMPTLSGTY